MLMVIDERQLIFRGADNIDVHLGQLEETQTHRHEVIPNYNFWVTWRENKSAMMTAGVYCQRYYGGWKVYLAAENLVIWQGAVADDVTLDASAPPVNQAVKHIFLDVQEEPVKGARRDKPSEPLFTEQERSQRYKHVVLRKDVLRRNARTGIALAIHDEVLRSSAPPDIPVRARKYVVAVNDKAVVETARIDEAVRAYDTLTDSL